MQSRYSVLFVEEVSWGGQAFSESSGDVVSGAAVAALRVDVLHTLADRRSCNEERDGERGGEGGRELLVVRIGSNTQATTQTNKQSQRITMVSGKMILFFFSRRGGRQDGQLCKRGRAKVFDLLRYPRFLYLFWVWQREGGGEGV